MASLLVFQSRATAPGLVSFCLVDIQKEVISVSLRHKAPQTKIKQMSFILKWPTGNVSLSSHLALLRSKVTSSSSNPGFLPSKTPPPGCQLWSPDSVAKMRLRFYSLLKMSTEWVCHFNNYYIWLLFFLCRVKDGRECWRHVASAFQTLENKSGIVGEFSGDGRIVRPAPVT